MKLFTVYGIAERGTDTLLGKKFVEVDDPLQAIQLCLKEEGMEEFSKEYILDWFDEEREGVFSFSDDNGFYVYVGDDKKQVLDVWSEYLI